MKLSDQALAEIAHGKKVAQRNGRLEALNWLVNNRLVSMLYNVDGDRQQAWLGRVYAPDEPGGTLLAECPNDNDYPTEAFLAQVALGLMAHGVAIPERPAPRKAPGAEHVIDWKKWAPA
jgi:hypothetical protein